MIEIIFDACRDVIVSTL